MLLESSRVNLIAWWQCYQ